MQQSAGDGWARIRAFLNEGMWRAELEPRTWTARGVALLQFAVMVGEGFVRDNLLLRASALTYFAVLSIVPLLAIVGAILTALGVTESVVEPLVRQFAAGSPEAQQKLLEVVQNANIRGLGTLGAATLFLTTVLGISNVERALNHIWGVKQERPWSRRLPDYLAVLVVAPLLLGTAFSLATTLKTQWIVQKLIEFRAFAIVYDTGLQQTPKVFMALAFGFVYWFLPNTRSCARSPRCSAACVAGAAHRYAAQGIYLDFSVGMAHEVQRVLRRASRCCRCSSFGSTSFWAIALFGAEIAFAHQNLAPLPARGARSSRPAPPSPRGHRRAHRPRGRDGAFRDSPCPRSTADALSDALRRPGAHGARRVADHLVDPRQSNIGSPR